MPKTEKPDSYADLRSRLDALERERDALQAKLDARDEIGDAGSGGVSKPRGRWRAPVSAVMIILGALFAPLSAVAGWTGWQLTDTDRFVETYGSLADSPAVQQLVADQAVAYIEEATDLPALTSSLIDGLDDLGANDEAVGAARSLEAPINLGLRNMIRTGVETVVESEVFSASWHEALRLAHTQFLATMNGDEGATLSIASDGSLQLQIGPVISAVKDQLVASGFEVAANIPEVDLAIEIARDAPLAQVKTGYHLAVLLGTWLPFVSLALLIGGVVVARRRRRAFAGAALAVAIAMAGLIAGLSIGGAVAPSVTPLPANAVADVYAILTDALIRSATAILAISLSLVLTAWLLGPGKIATSIRMLVVAGATGLREAGDRFGIGTGAFGRWLTRWQVFVRVVIATMPALVVLFARPLTFGLVVNLLVWVVILLILLEILRRPLAEREPDAETDTAQPGAEDAEILTPSDSVAR